MGLPSRSSWNVRSGALDVLGVEKNAVSVEEEQGQEWDGTTPWEDYHIRAKLWLATTKAKPRMRGLCS